MTCTPIWKLPFTAPGLNTRPKTASLPDGNRLQMFFREETDGPQLSTRSPLEFMVTHQRPASASAADASSVASRSETAAHRRREVLAWPPNPRRPPRGCHHARRPVKREVCTDFGASRSPVQIVGGHRRNLDDSRQGGVAGRDGRVKRREQALDAAEASRNVSHLESPGEGSSASCRIWSPPSREEESCKLQRARGGQ